VTKWVAETAVTKPLAVSKWVAETAVTEPLAVTKWAAAINGTLKIFISGGESYSGAKIWRFLRAGHFGKARAGTGLCGYAWKAEERRQ
jgi:hypothetical protein